MKRGMVIFGVGVVVLMWLLGAAFFAAKDAMGQLAGLIFLPAMAIPLILAYVAHNMSGATGNPFKGLVWGNTSWYFLTWLLGLLVAAVAILVAVGVGFNGLDLAMSSYLEMVIAQAQQNAGGGGAGGAQAMEQGIKVVAYITAIGSPTIGVWVGAAIACIGTFPWYGWFFRRAMVYGRANAIMLVMLLSLLTGVVGALADNPMLADMPMWMKMVLAGLGAIAPVPAAAWVFLRTRSAVVPAMALISYQNGLMGATPFLSIEVPFLGVPSGLVAVLVALATGIGLWVWKDPGGMDLAVAAVAHDGTPLTPDELAGLKDDVPSQQPRPEPAPTTQGGLVPPPPVPGEIEKLPPPDSSTADEGDES